MDQLSENRSVGSHIGHGHSERLGVALKNHHPAFVLGRRINEQYLLLVPELLI